MNSTPSLEPNTHSSPLHRGGLSKGVPLGLPPGAPSAVETPSGSFVRFVEPAEVCRTRLMGYIVVLWAVSFPLLAIFGLPFAALLDEKDPHQLVILIAILIAFAVFAIVSILVGNFYGQLIRHFMVRAIRARPNRLFDPDYTTIFLNIEDSRTSKKTKLLPDDFGLLHIVRGKLFIEMGKTRVCLMANDIRLAYDEVSKRSTELRIANSFGPYEWAISVLSISRFGSLSSLQFGPFYISPHKRCEDLWRIIYERINTQAWLAGLRAEPGTPSNGPQPGIGEEK